MRKIGKGIKKYGMAYLFILPALILISIFMLIPLARSFYLSVFKWNGMREPKFVGMKNFVSMIRDPKFSEALTNTLIYMCFTVALTIIIGMLLAIVIERRLKGWKAYKFIYYIPVMMSITVVATLFAKIYEPNYGILNSLLGFLGLDFLKQAWLGNPATVLGSIIFTSVWQYSGFTMILFLVAFEGISPDIQEAATLEGVTEPQRIRYITLPCVKRIIFVTIMLQMIFSFKSFDIIWVMTKGGPGTSSEILGTLLYKTAFNYQDFGYASAIAVIMTVIIGTISLFYMKLSNLGGQEI